MIGNFKQNPKKMEDGSYCFTCQDFEKNVRHVTKWCPKIVCQKCGQNGHVKAGCMFGLEDFPLPNEITLQILSYLHEKDLEQCAKVSRRFMEICDKRLEEVKNFESNQHVMSGTIKLHLEIKPTSIDIFPHSLIKTMVNDGIENAKSFNMEWKKMLKKLNISQNQDDLKMLLTNFGELEKRDSKGNLLRYLDK